LQGETTPPGLSISEFFTLITVFTPVGNSKHNHTEMGRGSGGRRWKRERRGREGRRWRRERRGREGRRWKRERNEGEGDSWRESNFGINILIDEGVNKNSGMVIEYWNGN
jgi:hypothetical protein